jgi:hypothetical protein
MRSTGSPRQVVVDHFDRSVVENQVELLTEGADANRL